MNEVQLLSLDELVAWSFADRFYTLLEFTNASWTERHDSLDKECNASSSYTSRHVIRKRYDGARLSYKQIKCKLGVL